MPRQPLHQITDQEPVVFIGPETFERRPMLATYVAQVIAGWAQVEISLACVLAHYDNADIENSVDTYLNTKGFMAQAEILNKTARAALTPENYDLYEATIKFINSNYQIRNDMAHWTWGVTDLLPEALIIIEPKANKKIAALAFNMIGQDMRVLAQRIMELQSRQKKGVFVYRKNDLKRCVQDMFAAEVLADRLQQLKSSKQDMDEGRAILLKRPEIRQHYDKIVADRTKAMEARPGGPSRS